MGTRALHGFHQFQRQDLLGGRYSLLGIPHDNEFLPPDAPVAIHADFWVNFLWKRLIGARVFNATLSPGSRLVRAFAHCGTPPSPHRPGAAGGLGLVLVNLAESSRTVQVASEEDAVELQVWTLTPTSAGPFGAGALLNGKALPTHVADGRTIDDIPVPAEAHAGSLELAPLSVTFATAPKCPG